MNRQPSSISREAGPDRELAVLIEQLTARLQAGEQLDEDELVAAHPDHAERLRQLLPALRLLADAAPSGDSRTAREGSGLPAEPIGDFQLIREVGRGGMGIVYEAIQMSLNRRVALKVLPWAAAMDPKQLQRFKNEALAAASLKHDHIVHVYGVGCERGVHFYAMEFIDGQTVAQVIGERGRVSAPSLETSELGALTQPRSPDTAPIAALSTKCDKTRYRAIAALVADAADALEHAHSVGIVHRDVKPGNLLLDNNGKIYVSDFGLARMASPGCEAGGLTMSGDLLGTLRYMAPEQALAKHGLADHRVDVYGLGCTLYELLTGKPAVKGNDKEEILKHIAFEEPIALRKLDKSVPSELETITLKCLAKEPGERFASAGELAADLRRWLDDKPIKAKPPGLREKVWKWTGRHRAGIAVAVSLLFLATVGLTASVALLAKKERETAKANSQSNGRLDQLQRANNLLSSIFEKLDPRAEQKGGPTVEEQLKAQLRRAVQQLDGEAIGDELTVASLQDTLGKSLLGLGEPTEAVNLLEKAVATRRRMLGGVHEETLVSLANLASAYEDAGRYPEAVQLAEFVRDAFVAKNGADHPESIIAVNDLALAFQLAGRLPESIQLLDRVRQVSADKLGADHRETVAVIANLASVYQDSGNLPRAIELYQEVYNIEAAKLGAEHPTTLSTRNNLASAYHEAGNVTEAIRIYEQVRAARVAKLGATHPATLVTLNNLAAAYHDLGKLPEAIRLYEQARDAQTAKLGKDHPNTLKVLGNLAGAYQDDGRLTEAIKLYEQVRDGLLAKLGKDHPDTWTNLSNLAEAYQVAGRLPEALQLFLQVRDLQLAKLGANHPSTLTTLHHLAGAYHDAGNLVEATRLYEQVRDGRIAKLGPNHPDTLSTLNNLALAYQAAGRVREAIRMFQQLCEAHRAKLGADHPETLMAEHNLGCAFQAVGRLPDAMELLENVRDARVAKLGADHPDTLSTMNSLASVYQALGRLPEAIRLFEQVHEASVTKLGANHPHTTATLNNLARAYQHSGKLPDAIRLFKQARELMVKQRGVDHPDTLTTTNNLAIALQESGRLSEAIRLFEELRHRRTDTLGANHFDTLTTLNSLAVAYQNAGRFQEAIQFLEQVRDARTAMLGADHPETLTTLNNLASAFKSSGKIAEAVTLFEQASVGVERLKFQHPYANRIINNTIDCYIKANDLTKAKSWQHKWTAVVKDKSGAKSPEFAGELAKLGAIQILAQKYTDAESTLRECLAIRSVMQPKPGQVRTRN